MHVLRPDELAALLRDADQDEEGYEYRYDDDDDNDGGGGGGGEYQQQRNQQRKEEEDKENSFDDDDDGPGKSTKTTVGERRRLSFQPEEDVQDLEDADDINETRVLLETMKRHLKELREDSHHLHELHGLQQRLDDVVERKQALLVLLQKAEGGGRQNRGNRRLPSSSFRSRHHRSTLAATEAEGSVQRVDFGGRTVPYGFVKDGGGNSIVGSFVSYWLQTRVYAVFGMFSVPLFVAVGIIMLQLLLL